METDDWAVEVKSTIAATPGWLMHAWNQALKAASETGKTPVVIRSHVDGGRRTFWLIERIDSGKDED